MSILLAVRVLTYNQELYIRQCLDGIVCQKTNFKFKVFIGEDCSTDKTLEICKEFEQKYPDKFIVKSTDENNLLRNSLDNFELCFKSGAKYIALLDGDDYWTDPLKLQKQVDLMENHEINYCFCNYRILRGAEFYSSEYESRKIPKILDLHELLRLNVMPITLSVVFKAESLRLPLPKILFESFNADWVLLFIIAHKGKIGYVKDEIGVYRKGVGVISKTDLYTKFSNGILTNKTLNHITNYDYSYHIGKQEWHLENIVYALLDEKKFVKAFLYSIKKVFRSGVDNNIYKFLSKNSVFIRHSLKLLLKGK